MRVSNRIVSSTRLIIVVIVDFVDEITKKADVLANVMQNKMTASSYRHRHAKDATSAVGRTRGCNSNIGSEEVRESHRRACEEQRVQRVDGACNTNHINDP